MSEYISLIKFGKLCLEMSPSFLVNTEKMDKVEVVIYSEGGDQKASFTIAEEESQSIDIPQQAGQGSAINGKMYLDLSKEKIIFEGAYKTDKHSGTIWLEVNPNYQFFQNQKGSGFESKIIVDCEDYPMSVGALTVDLAPKAIATENTIGNKKTGVIVKLMENKKDTDVKVYLHTILNENMRVIRGIDTCIEENETGFIGDVGIIHNKVYIDGQMVENGMTNCYFYVELGEDFLSK